MKNLSILLLVAMSISYVNAQKKVLDHESTYDTWQRIQGREISRDGQWVSYYLEPIGGGDPVLKIKDNKGGQVFEADRGSNPVFSFNSKQLIFKISPDGEEVKDMRRSKVDKDKLPKDSLAIFNLGSSDLAKISMVKSFKVPEKWSGWMAYMLEPDLPENGKKDTTEVKEEKPKAKKAKKENKDNGFRLVIRNLETAEQDTFKYVTDYNFAKEGARLSFVTTGSDSTWLAGVYSYDFDSKKLDPVFRSKGKYKQLTWDESGSQLAFVADLDTTKVQIRPVKLHYWKTGADTATAIAYEGHSKVPNDWIIGSESSMTFSKDGSRLYFGTAPKPSLKDTMLLDEEIVNLEVWNHTDGKLHTQQKVEMDRDLKKSFTAVFNTAENTIVQLGQENIPDIRFVRETNSKHVLGSNSIPYHQYITWEGGSYSDLYIIDVQTGQSEKFAEKVRGYANLSPNGAYAYWYDRVDTAWFTYSIAQKKIVQITNNKMVPYYDEINDRPDYPSQYGMMSWTEDDKKILIYDRYDIWELDPEAKVAPVNLTGNGRSSKTTYRYVKLDDEERFISAKQNLILTAFHEKDKSESIYSYTYGKPGLKELTRGDFHFGRFIKAQGSDEVIYTKESFVDFPDIYLGDLSFKSATRISNANPQQSEYNWGTAELYSFTSLDGQELEGMLIKPEGFDPTKKYPMMVNFYEKSSNGLHRHRSPSPPSSSINYSIYASRGYVIFNPNINYRIGYPGESAYDCVIPGVMSLIDKGFIDKDRIGIQGHSWGGYQISYLITKTDLFACAEAGAPVVNMTSAYGGIRWGSGMSRMFQYERTQSRIGGTLWEYPLRYIENSPLFFTDKINTPVMYMHNDADTAVPWYQGIEFFVALRRLGKPVWMLNYQGEPHGLRKMQNKKDFGLRMQQFFDYYLQDQPKPDWMENGIPAVDVGIEQHLLPADH